MMARNVAVLVGSLRQGSFNRKLAEAIGRLAADRLTFEFLELGDLPMINQDIESPSPEPVGRLKRQVRDSCGVLFVTPEYNRSFSPVIKNAIDWGTRPAGDNCWDAKPAAIIGTSPGAIGTAAAQQSLKAVVTVCGMVLMGQPEVYFAYKPELFDTQGDLLPGKTRDFFDNWVNHFTLWIDRTAQTRADSQADAS